MIRFPTIFLCLLALGASGSCKVAGPPALKLDSDVMPPFGLAHFDGAKPYVAGFDAEVAPGPNQFEFTNASGVHLSIYVDDITHTVGNIFVDVPTCTEVRTQVAQWGASRQIKNDLEDFEVWRGRASSWVASLGKNPAGCRLAFLNSAVFGPRPGSLTGFNGTQWGMSRSEVLSRLPNATADNLSALSSPPRHAPKNVIGGDVFMHYDKRERVSRFGQVLPTLAFEAVDRAWGQRIAHEDHLFWFDAVQNVRAIAKIASPMVQIVYYDQFLPIETWLGDGPDIAALRAPVLGQSLTSVRAAYADVVEPDDATVDTKSKFIVLQLPPTKWSDSGNTRVQVGADSPAGEVTQVTFSLPFHGEPERADLLAMLQKKWGPATANADSWTFPATRNMQVVVSQESSTKLLVKLVALPR